MTEREDEERDRMARDGDEGKKVVEERASEREREKRSLKSERESQESRPVRALEEDPRSDNSSSFGRLIDGDQKSREVGEEKNVLANKNK